MRFHWRAIFALSAVVVLNLAIHDKLGFYTREAFIGVMIAFSLALIASLMPDWQRKPASAIDGDLLVLTCVALAMTTLNINSLQISFSPAQWALDAIRACSFAGFVICFLSIFRPPLRPLVSPISWRDVVKHYRGILLGFAIGIAVMAARVALDIAYVKFETIAAFTLLYAFGVWIYLRRHTLLRSEAVDQLPAVLPWFMAAMMFGLAFRGAIVFACPEPIIDVYAMMRDSTDHLLACRNPYAEDIVSPYGTKEAIADENDEPADPRPAGYPPHPFLVTAPFRALGLDPRWADVACDGIAAAALVGVGLRRGRPRAGFLAATVFLFLPRTTVVLESAWYEPMIAAFLGVGFWLVESFGWRRWLGYVFIGFALTAKQYGAPLLPAIAWPHRQHWRMLLVGLLFGGFIMLPWFIWSPTDFMDIVIWKHLDRPSQHKRAMTVAAWCYHTYGMLPKRELLWLAAAGLIGLVSWRAPRSGAATALALGTALLIFCLFHTQGFINYFYLIQYLWLLGVVGLLTPVSLSPKGPSP